MKIRTLIIDDEPLARERLRLWLASEPDIELVGECASGEEAVRAMAQQKPDLAFLDVQMPEMNGFEAIDAVRRHATDAVSGEKSLTELLPVIVFVTASSEHAVAAFAVHAADYLLKPVERERFDEALRRVRCTIEQRRSGTLGETLSEQLTEKLDEKLNKTLTSLLRAAAPQPEASKEPHLKRVAVKSGGRVFFLKAEDIEWIEAADNYVELHIGAKSHLVRETLSSMESKLDPAVFVRIHRSTIVNVDRIKELQPHFHGEYAVLLHDGTRLMLSRNYRSKLPHLLGKG